MKLKILSVFLILTIGIYGQITNEGVPESWKVTKKQYLKKRIQSVKMPSFDLDRIREEDKVNDKNRAKPWRFGYEFTVDLGINNAGVWDELPNGDRIWRISILSEGAKTLNFIFDTYKLPSGASLYLYNVDHSFKLGAYTGKMNNEYNALGTWIADGEEIVIEYYEPAAVKGLGELHIGSVIHGYRSESNYGAYQKGLNDSDDCNQDVNCSVGDDFDSIKDELKKSVVLILANGNDWCTGTLINNTSNNQAPYVLTAHHCSGNEATWSFRFNWISENTVCADTTDSIDNGDSNYFEVTSGATVLAKNSETDFNLVKINGGLDLSWDLEWAGWDNSGDFPDFVVGIHHPNGDIMKVSRENDTLTQQYELSDGQWVYCWEINDWDMGVTERGSSGSALFNERGRIIGQLFSGAAACNGTDDNGQPDYYGRFDMSWDFGDTRETRLSDWLDPEGTGKTSIDILSEEILKVGGTQLDGSVLFFPNPAKDIIKVANKTGEKLIYDIFDVKGQRVQSGEVLLVNDEINVSSYQNGVYFVVVKKVSDYHSFTRKIMIRN